MVIIIVVITLYLRRLYINKHNNYYDSIIIQKNPYPSLLFTKIDNAFVVKSEINRMVRLLPITDDFSHWMLMVKTNGKYYLISTSSKHYVEIIYVDYRGGDYFSYDYQNKKYYCFITSKHNVTNNINIMEASNKLIEYYHKYGTYSLLHNNCQTLTTILLTEILNTDYKNSNRKSVMGITKELFTNFGKYRA